jgi:hypothetical protein
MHRQRRGSVRRPGAVPFRPQQRPASGPSPVMLSDLDAEGTSPAPASSVAGLATPSASDSPSAADQRTIAHRPERLPREPDSRARAYTGEADALLSAHADAVGVGARDCLTDCGCSWPLAAGSGWPRRGTGGSRERAPPLRDDCVGPRDRRAAGSRADRTHPQPSDLDGSSGCRAVTRRQGTPMPPGTRGMG